jgi:hypothetical protein
LVFVVAYTPISFKAVLTAADLAGMKVTSTRRQSDGARVDHQHCPGRRRYALQDHGWRCNQGHAAHCIGVIDRKPTMEIRNPWCVTTAAELVIPSPGRKTDDQMSKSVQLR